MQSAHGIASPKELPAARPPAPVTSAPRLSLGDPPRAREYAGSALVALAACVLYPLLTSDLPIDDTARFTPSIAAGVYEWDPAHLLMQPAALWWHKAFGGTALGAQHAVNVASIALSFGALWRFFGLIGRGLFERACLIALVAFSFNVLVLGTSGHMKLLVMPFLVLALCEGTVFEIETRTTGRASPGRVVRTGVWLGIAVSFLVSSVLAVPAMALAAALVAWRAHGAASGLRAGLALGVAAGATIGLVFLAAYLASSPDPSVAGYFRFGLSSQAEGQGGSSTGLVESVSRLGFGLGLNFVHLADLGSVLRARLTGALPSLAGYGDMLLWPAIAFGITLGFLGLLGLAWLRFAREVGWMAWAQCLAMLAFATVWNLSEAEFYFPATAPLVVVAALLPSTAKKRALLFVAGSLMCAINLATYTLPRRPYPFDRYQAELQAEFGPRDLLVSFLDYAGGPYLGFFEPLLERVPHFELDRRRRLEEEGPDAALAALHAEVQAAFERGGRVVVFRILDARDWNGPWAFLRSRGLPKERVEGELHDKYEVLDLGTRAEIPCWELKPAPGR